MNRVLKWLEPFSAAGIGFMLNLAAVIVGLVLFIRSRVLSGSGSGRGSANPTLPNKF